MLFDSHRDDWTNPRTFEQMYNEVYKKMAECGIAEKTDKQVGTTVQASKLTIKCMHRDDLPATV